MKLTLHFQPLLLQEKIQREESFEKLRRGITATWSDLDIGPEDESEYELLNGTPKSISKVTEKYPHTLGHGLRESSFPS